MNWNKSRGVRIVVVAVGTLTWTIAFSPVTSAEPDSETPSNGLQPSISFTFEGEDVTGVSHHSGVDSTLGSYSDPGLQAEMAAVGLKPARPDKCTSLYVSDSGFIACAHANGPLGVAFLRILNPGTGEPAYADAPEQVVVTWSDVATLPIETGNVVTQFAPDVKPLIHVEVPAMSSAQEHTLTMTLLDTPVEVRLTPVQWDWDFGQDEPPRV